MSLRLPSWQFDFYQAILKGYPEILASVFRNIERQYKVLQKSGMRMNYGHS